MSYKATREVSQNRSKKWSEKEDWHRADIIAALKKSGTTMSALSRANGLASTTLANALRFPWPKGEQIIAEQIGVSPEDIWPSRYQNVPKAS